MLNIRNSVILMNVLRWQYLIATGLISSPNKSDRLGEVETFIHHVLGLVRCSRVSGNYYNVSALENEI